MTSYEQGYLSVLEKLGVALNLNVPKVKPPTKPPSLPKNLFNKKFKSGRTMGVTPQIRPLGINIKGTF